MDKVHNAIKTWNLIYLKQFPQEITTISELRVDDYKLFRQILSQKLVIKMKANSDIRYKQTDVG
jgi:hypothetical protein